MQRTLNYTGRKKIFHHEVIFTIIYENDTPEFNVDFRFDKNSFSDDASVFVEASCNLTRQRFDFGTVSKLVPPRDCRLSEIDLSGCTLFKVLVVDNSGQHGLLLASGKDFKGDQNLVNDANKDSILPLTIKPMEQLLWKIGFEGGSPELYLNSNIPNAKEKMKVDPYFQALVLPAALREVLMYLIWNESDDDDTEISNKWMEFATYFGDSKPDGNDPDVLMSWVNDVVQAFSNRFEMCNRLLKVMGEE